MFIFSVITELFYKHAFQSIYTTIDEDTWANDVTRLNMVIHRNASAVRGKRN